jgi:hypothetical protein
MIAEILAFLLAATLIGAAMAWLLRGLRSQVSERRLLAELEEVRAGRDSAEAAVRTLEAALADLRQEREREANRLRTRLAQLEALLEVPRGSEPAQTRLPNAASGLWQFLLRLVSGLMRLFQSGR